METATRKPNRLPRCRAPRFVLRLYVADQTPRSLLAVGNLKEICRRRLIGRCRIEVIDILARPEVARVENIVAVPTLVRISPGARRTVVGALTEVDRVLSGLQIEALSASR